MSALIRSFLGGFAEIFFLRGAFAGAVLLALTLSNPPVAAMGAVAYTSAFLFGRLIGMRSEYLVAGHYVYNIFLTGACLGYITHFSIEAVLFAAVAGIFVLLLTMALVNLFSIYAKLPVLSVPFLIGATAVWLVTMHSFQLAPTDPHEPFSLLPEFVFPAWLGGFFRSLGMLIVVPNTTAGIVIAGLILSRSRILFMLAIAGYYAGETVTAALFVPWERAFDDPSGYNYTLTAMCVGGVFLVPAPRSYAVALGATALSALCLNAAFVLIAPTGVPTFTLSFNVAALLTLYALRLAPYPLLATRVCNSPEETLEDHFTMALRFPHQYRTLYLPFSGRWSVWQAFDGPWTHKGKWQHAYDFVLKDESGKTHADEGKRLEDYYCFQKPVLSPVRGRVVHLVDYLPDNIPGTVDRSQSFGNWILIWDERGFYVKIAHLAANSLRVRIGDAVEPGTVIGLCGNSGHSPQPHIHIQVQLTAEPAASTTPFAFISYTDGQRFYSNALPASDSEVEPLYPDRGMDLLTAHVLDQELNFDVLRLGRPSGQLRLTVQMALDGSYFLASSAARLYFGKHEGTFYFYRLEGDDPWLAALFTALPRLPLSYREALVWRDCLPAGIALRSWGRHAAELLSAFHPPLSSVRTEQTFVSRYRIRTVWETKFLGIKQSAEVELHPQNGISRVQTNEFELRRISA